MAAALGLLVVPAILLTLVAVLMLKSAFGAAGLIASAVFLALLYFMVFKLLRTMRRWDHDEQVSSLKELKQAEREGEQAESAALEQLELKAVREANHRA